MKRLPPHSIKPSGDEGDVLTTVSGVTEWAPPMALTVQDENGDVATGVTQVDFQGAGVSVASGTGEVIVTIPGGGTPEFHGCHAIRTATLSITQNTPTAVSFNDTDAYDTDSLHDPSTNNTRITIPSGMAGVWDFGSTITWASSTSVTLRSLQFSVNGSVVTGGGQRTNGVSGISTFQSSRARLNLAAGDYVEVIATQGSSGSLNVTGIFTCHFLGTP